MAVDVHTLLTLPSSKAFSSFRSSPFGAVERSDSPPRKTPRLEADSDSASASRSRLVDASNTASVGDTNTLALRLQGPPIKTPASSTYDSYFNIIRASIRILLDSSITDELPATYEKLYSACRAVVCEADRGEGLYENLKLSLEQCVGRVSRQLLELSQPGIHWLQSFVEACEWFEGRVHLLESLLVYLDKVYAMKNKGVSSIRSLAYQLFIGRVFEDQTMVAKIQDGVKEWVETERVTATVHDLRGIIVRLVGCLAHHDQYQRIFEHFFLKVTREFYLEESAKLRESLSAPRFLVRCEERDLQEQKICEEVLLPRSWGQVKDTVRRAQLSDSLEWIAKQAIPPLMEVKDLDGLRRMYRMFAAVDGHKIMLFCFKAQVETGVVNIVKDIKDDENMVPKLLEFKDFGDKLVSTAFVDEVKVSESIPSNPSTSAVPMDIEPRTDRIPNKEFGYAMIDAFAKGFKSRRNKPAELIAKYIDKAMRRGQKGKEDRTYTAELDAALGLYRFTDDKDVFRAFYHRALAKRLLLEKSASDDHEKAMLKKLKEQYDPEFSMGDQMFTDLSLSRDLMKEYLQPRVGALVDTTHHKVTVMVLQHSVWPFAGRKENVALPEWMGEELQAYMNFYRKKHSGHKLDWDHSLGIATVRARFSAGEKELSVSLYQAIILLLFNEGDEKPFSEIKMLTQMEDGELRRILQSLACGKKRVLKKQPPGKDVNDGDIFFFNADFTDHAYRVHINSIQVKETAEETQRTQTLIEGDRKYALDAAIVRVMKGKKQLQYEQLKTATIEAVKQHFKPDIPMIKKRIDNLVENDYLRRDEDDMNLLIYVA
ncbi:Cullin-domain-containing protein [Trametopsis cervina]|nr:Cullin-domain-containing protein [Trametopsis cervina]